MHKLHFSIKIAAPREKVWKTLLEDATYRQWTAPFNPGGSYFEGSWEQGSTMKFLGPDKDGKLGGMLSRVVENRPNELVSLEHVGQIKDGKEDTTSDEVKRWSGAHETYTLKDVDGGTELSLDVDAIDEFKDFFEEAMPKAFAKLRQLAEA